MFNNKKKEPDSVFSDYSPTESVFGNQSIFEDSGPTVSVFSSGFSALTPARERYLPNGACAWYSNIGGREVTEDSEIICESLMKCGSDGSFPDRAAVKAGFESANRELVSKQKNKFHMKSTAVYLCINDNKAIWARIGDSRLYHLYGGKLCDYTMDHSASQMAVLLGEITREQIPSDPGRSRLLRAMGAPEVKPDIHDPVLLRAGLHCFLLCTDGFWEYLSDEVITEEFSRARTPKEFINKLYAIKVSKSDQDCDNNSAVAVFCKI